MEELKIRILDDEELPHHPPKLLKRKHKIWGKPDQASVQVLCSQNVIRGVEEFSRQSNKEVGGVLLGQAYRYEGDIFVEIVALIRADVFSDQQSSTGHFQFTEETWAAMLRIKDSNPRAEKMKIVGWFHSHPGHGIFLSPGQDTFIHENYFSQPWQVAMVYDPIKHHGGFYVWEEGKLIRSPGFIEQFSENSTRSAVSWKNDPYPRIKKSVPDLWGDYILPGILLIIIIAFVLFFFREIRRIDRVITEQNNRIMILERTLLDLPSSTIVPSNTVFPTETSMPAILPTDFPTATETSTLTDTVVIYPTTTPSPSLTPGDTTIIEPSVSITP